MISWQILSTLVILGMAVASPLPQRRPVVRPGAVPVGVPVAALVKPAGGQSIGAGTGSVVNGTATGAGVANAQPAPGGFGVAVGVGQSISTPFGSLAFGQGQATNVGKYAAICYSDSFINSIFQLNYNSPLYIASDFIIELCRRIP